MFEELQENFEEISEKVVKTFKKKPFLIAGLIIGLVVIVYFMMKKNSSEDEISASYAVVPSGYDGYPEMSESVSYDDVVNQLLNETNGINSSYYDTIVSEVTDALTKERDEMNTRLEESMLYYSEREQSYQDTIDELTYEMQKQNIITQMQTNSSLYAMATSDAERQALHDSNVLLGEKLGATYNANDGTWWLDGERLYYTLSEQKGSIENDFQTTTPTNSTQSIVNVSYDKNTDYQREIYNALLNGESAETVNNLYAQREAKIQGENITPTVTYDKNVDYANLINIAKSQGASQEVISSLEAQRQAKIQGENLTQYQTPSTNTSSGSSAKVSVSGSSGSGTKKTTTTTTTPKTTTTTTTKKNTSSSSSGSLPAGLGRVY